MPLGPPWPLVTVVTQSMVLSATINNRVSCGSHSGLYSIVVVTAGVGKQDSAADG